MLRTKIWKWIETAHTAHWLLAHVIDSALTGAVVAWIAANFDHIPISVSILLGMLGFTIMLFGLQLFRAARRENSAPQVETTAHAQGPARPRLAGQELNDVHIRNRDVHIIDLIVDVRRVRGRTFEDCVINGPAVIAPLRCVLDNSLFEGAAAANVVIPIWPNRSITGSILVKDCVFRRCIFRNISVIQPAEPPDDAPQAVAGQPG